MAGSARPLPRNFSGEAGIQPLPSPAQEESCGNSAAHEPYAAASQPPGSAPPPTPIPDNDGPGCTRMEVGVAEGDSSALPDRRPSEQQTAELAQLLPGVDFEKICSALRRVGTTPDTGMTVEQFHKLYEAVFAGRPIDSKTWANVEELFEEIDKSGDGEVDLIELLSYLSEPIQSTPRPTTTQGWLWVIVSPFGAAGVYDPRLSAEDTDRRVVIVQLVYKFLAQVFIILAVVQLMIESLPSMQWNRDGEDPGDDTTFGLEVATIVWFTLEMIIYICAHPRGPLSLCSKRDPDKDPDASQGPCCLPLFVDPILLVDFVSIFPFYFELGTQAVPGLKAIVAIRFVRLLRMLKVLRTLRMVIDPGCFVPRMPKLLTALKRSFPALLWLAVLIFVLLSVSSSWVFFAERDEAHFDMSTQKWVRDATSKYIDAGEVTNFQSIPDAMWWSVVTITTVGYGDKFPVTDGGKFIGGVTILSGLIIIAFPITILGSVFQGLHDEQQQADAKLALCRDFMIGCRKWFASGGKPPKTKGAKNPHSLKLSTGSMSKAGMMAASDHLSCQDGEHGHNGLAELRAEMHRMSQRMEVLAQSVQTLTTEVLVLQRQGGAAAPSQR
eukprot:TRINITY_DN5741_c0_g1_i2.p1 TRINITY_DN5741_c0_g1~~TRINITY_DN5741_c0_g1_i2.p1  ORF type:complete len:658 (+),score=128.82 TRINITY_DN5741_c0_g1_i2:148-1974(+)